MEFLKMMKEFQSSLPDGFRKAISSPVVTMKEDKKKKQGIHSETYNTDLLFSRVSYLVSIGHLEFERLFHFELSPFPTAFCNDSGEPKYITTKSTLKNKLKSSISSRNLRSDCIIIDGNAMLHSATHWPKNSLVTNLIDGVKAYIFKLLEQCDIYLIFDRYYEFSIKSNTRNERIGAFKKHYNLSLNMPLPPKEATMTSSKTKFK